MATGDGLVSMTPTSVDKAGTGSETATINADGGVDFTAVTSLSLNGVFTGDYDNYVIFGFTSTTTQGFGNIRLRASGSDASGSDYNRQYINMNNTTVDANRSTGQTSGAIFYVDTTYRNGHTIHLYGPALAQTTALRSVNVDSNNNARLLDTVVIHDVSTAYDGFTLILPSVTSGNFHVFGYEE